MFKSQRQGRYLKLRDAGFLPFEARELSKITTREAPYIRQMVRDRKAEVKNIKAQAEIQNLSKTQFLKELRDYVKFKYKEGGWNISKGAIKRPKMAGRPDPWQMLKDYRNRAIQQGDYFMIPTKKRRRFDEIGKRIDKGKVKEQKARYKKRQREARYA